MKVSPQYAASYFFHCVEKVMMIIPIDSDVREAKYVAHEHRPQRQQHVKTSTVGHLQFEHHDSDDDGDDAVAECFQPAFAHRSVSY